MPAADAKKILARDFIFEINTGSDALPTWVKIGGINTFSWDPSKSDADTTDFDSNGNPEHFVASRSYVLSVEGYHKEDTSDGARDAGQDAVEDLADDIGADSLGSIRYYHKVSLKGKQFKASARTGGPGGGNDDPASWSAEFTVSGPITAITVTP